MAAIEPHGPDVTLELRVRPKASRNAWHLDSEGVLRVEITAPPSEGEANRALLAFIAAQLGVPRSALTLLRGEHHRNKVVRAAGVTADTVRGVLKSG